MNRIDARLGRRIAALTGAAGIGLLAGGALLTQSATAAPSDQPSPEPSAGSSAASVATAGTSFLTAVGLSPARGASVGGSTGDFMYWSFDAKAGDTTGVAITVSLPPAADRHGSQTWNVEIFDGLRRRQACTAGAQSPVAEQSATSVDLNCALRQVRAWAEPWSGDPLPGTYYIRLSAAALPDQDLGLPVKVSVRISTDHDGDTTPEGGKLTEPLVPAVDAGTARATVPASPSSSATSGDYFGWLPDASSRWAWTAAGGVIAAGTGIVGFAMFRRFIGRPGR